MVANSCLIRGRELVGRLWSIYTKELLSKHAKLIATNLETRDVIRTAS